MSQYRTEKTLLEAMGQHGPSEAMLKALDAYCTKHAVEPDHLVDRLPAFAARAWTNDPNYADWRLRRSQPKNPNARNWFLKDDDVGTRDASVSLLSERFICSYERERYRLYQIADHEDKVVREVTVDRQGDVREVTVAIAKTLEREGCIVNPLKTRTIIDYYMDHGPKSPAPVLCTNPGEDAWSLHHISIEPADGLADALATWDDSQRHETLVHLMPTTMGFIERMNDPEAFAAWMYGIYSNRFRGRQMLWLQGPGLDGKSKFFEAYSETIFGITKRCIEWNTIKGQSQWVAGLVEGKKFVYVADCSNPKILLSEMFKSLSGEDEVTINRKNERQYSARLEAKMAVISNYSPFIVGEKHSMSRILPIKMAARDTTQPDNANFAAEIAAELPVFLAYGAWCYAQRCVADFEITPNAAVLDWIESRVLDCNEEFDAIIDRNLYLDIDPETDRIRAGSEVTMPRIALYSRLTETVKMRDSHEVAEFKEYLFRKGVTENTKRKFYRGIRLKTDDDLRADAVRAAAVALADTPPVDEETIS